MSPEWDVKREAIFTDGIIISIGLRKLMRFRHPLNLIALILQQLSNAAVFKIIDISWQCHTLIKPLIILQYIEYCNGFLIRHS